MKHSPSCKQQAWKAKSTVPKTVPVPVKQTTAAELPSPRLSRGSWSPRPLYKYALYILSTMVIEFVLVANQLW